MPQLRRNRNRSNTPTQEVKLRKVVPVIPTAEMEKELLVADLNRMGCAGLLDKPWGFKEERVVKELFGKLSNEFDNTLRGVPSKWTEAEWRAVYDFRVGGLGMANRRDEFCHGKFKGAVNPKDGYAVEDCIDARQRRVLEFLVPILHPEKPKRVTITLGNTILGALSCDRKVNWALIFSELVSQLFSRMGKSRATPLSPYLLHLYHHHQLLTKTEEKVWRDQEVLRRYGESEEEDDEATGSDSEEDEEPTKPPTKRQKYTSPESRRTPPGEASTPKKKDKGKGPEEEPAKEEGKGSGDPFNQLIEILCRIRTDWEINRRLLVAIGELLGAPADSALPERVAEAVTNPEEHRKQEADIRRLQNEVDALKAEVEIFKEEKVARKTLAEELGKTVEMVKATFGETGTTASKAKLYDEGVLKDKKLSSTRIVRILGDFAEQVEGAMQSAREAAGRMEEASHRLTELISSQELRLSDLSLPSLSMEMAATMGRGNLTPQSKKSHRGPSAPSPDKRIDIDSSPEVPNPADGERSRNLTEVFEQLQPEPKSPTLDHGIAA